MAWPGRWQSGDGCTARVSALPAAATCSSHLRPSGTLSEALEAKGLKELRSRAL